MHTPIPTTPQFATLVDVLAHHAHTQPDATALVFEGRAESYAQLHAHSQQLAAAFQARGIVAGDRVAWLGLNHTGQLLALFALARLGALLVPMNVRLAPLEWRAVLADCTPCLLVHDTGFTAAALDLSAQVAIKIVANDDLLAVRTGPALALRAEPIDPDSPTLLVYTSGTTGQPKGAVHTQAMLLSNMASAAQVQAMTAADRVLTVLPLFHVGGLCIQTLPAFYVGACVLLHARFDAASTLACIQADRPTLTLQVPATMKALIDHPEWPRTQLTSLRAVWAGSSLLPPLWVTAFLARGVPLCNVYGATETGPFSIALPPDQAQSHAGSCGWPAPGVQVRLDNAREGVGELLLRSPSVVKHYWPERPACDESGWFHTGDLATQATDGSYTVVGRAKDMVISGGENIYPAEVENALNNHPAVADSVVLGLPDARWGEVLAAVVVLHAETQATDEDLTAFLEQRLARYKLPRQYLRLPSLPRTALGKPQKDRLKALFN
jgi:fatty-acyl-CoA synthase